MTDNRVNPIAGRSVRFGNEETGPAGYRRNLPSMSPAAGPSGGPDDTSATGPKPSPLDRLLDEPGSSIRSDEELSFIQGKVNEYLRLRWRMLADEAEADADGLIPDGMTLGELRDALVADDGFIGMKGVAEAAVPPPQRGTTIRRYDATAEVFGTGSVERDDDDQV